MSRRGVCVLLLGLGMTGTQAALALDGSALELGHNADATMSRLSVRWNLERLWTLGHDWNVSVFTEAGLGSWQGDGAGAKDLWELGFTPVLRINSTHSGFFWEGGIGVHLMSHNRINDRHVFGSHFNFGDHLGFGWRLGDKERYELGYRFQHLSNANTAMPNDSINFHQLRLGLNY
ncbi:MAG: acyloxyacyl hydrolase [Pseudomonadota bacterium]